MYLQVLMVGMVLCICGNNRFYEILSVQNLKVFWFMDEEPRKFPQTDDANTPPKFIFTDDEKSIRQIKTKKYAIELTTLVGEENSHNIESIL